ncbi:Hypothetical Protein RradSPS_2763 [Rubrobacter radiotolerans]|uniref:Uncharacterized protein n=1 Tax=Rubrobacter radiotolerans TaxID=42256 RepID=A0A023X789_RUBRA|nr:hypothetical protein [Rubrobacter radiotolerans]AHY48046.1 Hypothetical Protein RradSPS_2763 [Rubrobacter radiotolerans]MDX5892685.1 hypothetical protein [Rubrobacter radiotolerans]SMC08118.1 conserved hypothetical protein [Rubrobacter radiotolerans DSM 5868]
MMDARVAIYVDYNSQLAKSVAESIWSGLTRSAAQSGGGRISTYWDGLDPRNVLKLATSRSPRPEGAERGVVIFAVGQDRPDAVDDIPVADLSGTERTIFGLVVAVPEPQSPLAGPLLYQGVERLTNGGVRMGDIEPALLRSASAECESYAERLMERLRDARGRAR